MIYLYNYICTYMYICMTIYTIPNINKTFYAERSYCGEVGKNGKMIKRFLYKM